MRQIVDRMIYIVLDVFVEFEHTYKVLQSIQQKLSASSSGCSQPLLRDDLFNLICLLGSPLFTRLVELDSSLSRLSILSRQLIALRPDDFDFDPSTGDLVMPPHPYQASDDEDDDLKRTAEHEKITVSQDGVEELLMQGAHSRKVELVELYKVEGGSLGFGVVGLRSDLRGELGIFVQEIQPGGLADKYVSNFSLYLPDVNVVVVKCIYEPYVFTYSVNQWQCHQLSAPFSLVCGQLLTIFDVIWLLPQGHMSVAARLHFF